MPKSAERCSTNMSHSSKLSGSSSTSSRSRAVSLPLPCCAATRLAPPPARAAARFSSSWRRMSDMSRGSVWPLWRSFGRYHQPKESASLHRPQTLAEPGREFRLGERAGGEGEHCLESVGHLRLDIVAIEIKEDRREQPGRALVAVDERMIPRDAVRIGCSEIGNV